jgi:putative transcription factor
LEDAIVEVCDDCSKFGHVIERVPSAAKAYKPMQKPMKLEGLLKDSETTFAPDYGKRVREARELRDLTRTDFARKINERESVIRRVERQTIEPDDALIKKIELFLNIKLKEREEYE